MREIEISTDAYYHIFNRSVDKQFIFRCDNDFRRFYASLYVFNLDRELPNNISRLIRSSLGDDQVKEILSLGQYCGRLVSICSFNLRHNHIHLKLQQKADNGISRFLHRIQMGHSKYFNLKYKRTGALFEGAYKAVLILNQSQFSHVPAYIHLNTLDITPYLWRDGIIVDWNKAFLILEGFKWSSHHVYMGKKQKLPVVDEEYIQGNFPDPEMYVKYLKDWSTRHCLIITE